MQEFEDFDEELEDEELEEDAGVERPFFYERLTEEQKTRFEAYRAASLPRTYVCHVAAETAGVQGAAAKTKVGNSFAIVLGGIAKVLVVELTEEARSVMAEQGATGPIRPEHIAEAHRRLLSRGSAISSATPRRLFTRR